MKKISYSKKINFNEGINYNEENKLFKEENQLKYKRGVIKVHARSFQILKPEFLI